MLLSKVSPEYMKPEDFPPHLFTVDGLLEIDANFSRLGGTLNHVRTTKPLPDEYFTPPESKNVSWIVRTTHSHQYIRSFT